MNHNKEINFRCSQGPESAFAQDQFYWIFNMLLSIKFGFSDTRYAFVAICSRFQNVLLYYR